MEYIIKTAEPILLDQRYDTMIPFSMTVRGNTVEIEAYDAVMAVVEEWTEKFGGDPLEAKSLDYLESRLSGFCEENGYSYCGYRNLKKMYICTPETSLNDFAEIETSVLDCGAEYSSVLEMGLTKQMWEGDDYPYRAVGVFDGDVLVCAACENSHYFDNDIETEIGVETAEDYRKRGYAAAATAELCRILLNSGRQRIYYECDVNNTASDMTAKRAGLDFYANTYYFVSYLDE